MNYAYKYKAILLLTLSFSMAKAQTQRETITAKVVNSTSTTFDVVFTASETAPGTISELALVIKIADDVNPRPIISISDNPFDFAPQPPGDGGTGFIYYTFFKNNAGLNSETAFPIGSDVRMASFEVSPGLPTNQVFLSGGDLAPFDSGGGNWLWFGTSATINGNETNLVAPISQAALPVEFSFFSAQEEDGNSLLKWETVSELNNDFFNVERSADGKSFETIGKVAGHGTTTEIQNYEFTDREPHAGLNYYRLKQVDFNGEYEYSKVETVDFRSGDDREIKVFPNPATNEVSVSLDRSYDAVRVTNQLGQLVEILPASLYESNQFKLDICSYPAGVYFMEAKAGLEIVNKQFVKIK